MTDIIRHAQTGAKNKEKSESAIGQRPSSTSQACSLSQPPNGIRITWNAADSLPSPTFMSCIKPVCVDVNGGPVYLASALLLDGSIQPCKVTTTLFPYHLRIPYDGRELTPNQSDFEFLVVSPDMEWVPAKKGRIPKDRRPVQGGQDVNGEELCHAMGLVQGWKVPGKTGLHYNCAKLPFGEKEHIVKKYEVLCWKEDIKIQGQ